MRGTSKERRLFRSLLDLEGQRDGGLEKIFRCVGIRYSYQRAGRLEIFQKVLSEYYFLTFSNDFSNLFQLNSSYIVKNKLSETRPLAPVQLFEGTNKASIGDKYVGIQH
jgi:hypothetical protein